MDTKEYLIKTVKEWVRLDNEMRTLQKEIAQRKNDKKKVSSILMGIMKNNEVDCVDLKDGQLCYVKKNVKKPITKTMLLGVLEKYFNGDQLKAAELNNYITDSRETAITETIVRKIDKGSAE